MKSSAKPTPINDEQLNDLRERRSLECFPIVNRGKLWYNCLTHDQIAELDSWYHKWLDVTETGYIPPKPEFLNDKLHKEEVIL